MAHEANLGLIALTRFGYGPRGDGDTAVAASDPRGFLAAELAEPGITLLSGPTLPSTAQALQQVFDEKLERKAERLQRAAAVAADGTKSADPANAPAPARAADGGMSPVAAAAPTGPQPPAAPPPSETKPQPVAKPPGVEQTIFRDEALARIRRAIQMRAGFAERLVAFWSNHFCVSAAKGGIGRATAGTFEREAIRPHVLGRFADMLLAAESHPAMLHFLDNVRSVGPRSRAGLRGHRGLNENLGREIMELHTLGVGGGYTQADVTNLAKILTGWSYVGPQGARGEPGTFVFVDGAHEPGPIELLGRVYQDQGLSQGRAALLDIARRPQTARFVATKLARAFIADVPPLALVDRLANIFQATDGDLKAVSLALVEAPEAWSLSPGKVRPPYDVIIATNRLLGHLPEDPGQVLGPLQAMGMALWAPPGPNGFATENATWASPEGMKLRLDYCALAASRLKTPPNPSDLLAAMCGGAPSPETRAAVARAESREQGLALLLMAPEMQRS